METVIRMSTTDGGSGREREGEADSSRREEGGGQTWTAHDNDAITA
jgi:hypothetical protein